MNTDQILVIGIIICVLAIPSLLNAFADSRSPRTGAIMVLIGGVLLAVAMKQRSGGYSFDEIPPVFMRVVGQLFN